MSPLLITPGLKHRTHSMIDPIYCTYHDDKKLIHQIIERGTKPISSVKKEIITRLFSYKLILGEI